MTRKPRRARSALALALAAGLILAACGSSSGGEGGGSAPDYGKALAGSPKPLAALHDQADQLLDGGTDAFEQRMTSLRGFPVVVNKWASWCGPCRAEFPFLQDATAKFGKKVAFLGVNSQDSDDAAKTFLGQYPVPYPSYTDPDQQIAEQLKATLGFPSTAFYDRRGEQVYLRQGGYPSEADLVADIKHYALGESEAN